MILLQSEQKPAICRKIQSFGFSSRTINFNV